MSERLTERNANGTAKSRKSPKSSYMGTVYEEMAEIQTEILNRLCDLVESYVTVEEVFPKDEFQD